MFTLLGTTIGTAVAGAATAAESAGAAVIGGALAAAGGEAVHGIGMGIQKRIADRDKRARIGDATDAIVPFSGDTAITRSRPILKRKQPTFSGTVKEHAKRFGQDALGRAQEIARERAREKFNEYFKRGQKRVESEYQRYGDYVKNYGKGNKRLPKGNGSSRRRYGGGDANRSRITPLSIRNSRDNRVYRSVPLITANRYGVRSASKREEERYRRKRKKKKRGSKRRYKRR